MSSRWTASNRWDAVGRTAAWALGLVFLAAAVPKMLHPHEFALAVFRYHLAPHAAVNLIAIALPGAELATGLLLCVSRSWRPAAALVALAMLATFTGAIAISLARGLDVACGCFSVSEEVGRIGAISLFRNALLMALAVAVLVTEYRRVTRLNGSLEAAG